jgi:hypothetical protein
MDEDGRHFWWGHDCQATRELWQKSGKVEADVVERFARGDLHPHMLPLGLPDGWILISKEPMTVRPSILCTRCGCHGWITKGEWVPA